jgi:hypothetical protein
MVIETLITASIAVLVIITLVGERGHTPSRGALCQYLVGRGPAREAEICLTASE